MTQRHILVVDDEIINLQIIEEYLDDPGYDLDMVTSAEQAWERLESNVRPYDLAILDRMMPGMNGIELLKKIKADPRFREIPVVMQTAATAPEQVREGIAAGAYYHLAKPYEAEVLLAIVRAVFADRDARANATRHALAHVRAMELLSHAEFSFRKLEEVGPLIEVLASLCPAPELAAQGLTELLVNAVEHGNLGITYDEKKRMRMENTWETEVERRQALAEYGVRKVRVRIERRESEIEFVVVDEGDGFDWQRYMEFDPERATDPNGRGIAMARALSFANLRYDGCGNTVIATIHAAARAPASI